MIILPELKGLSLASLKKLIKDLGLDKDPTLIKAFEEQLRNKDFKNVVDEAYEEIKDIFNHANSRKT